MSFQAPYTPKCGLDSPDVPPAFAFPGSANQRALLQIECDRLTTWLNANLYAPIEQRAAIRVARDNAADLLRLDNPTNRARTLTAVAQAEQIFRQRTA
jgi:hypothetical protein